MFTRVHTVLSDVNREMSNNNYALSKREMKKVEIQKAFLICLTS